MQRLASVIVVHGRLLLFVVTVQHFNSVHELTLSHSIVENHATMLSSDAVEDRRALATEGEAGAARDAGGTEATQTECDESRTDTRHGPTQPDTHTQNGQLRTGGHVALTG